MRLILLILMVCVVSWWIPFHGLAYLPQPRKTVTIYCDQSTTDIAREMSRELMRIDAYSRTIDIEASTRSKGEMMKKIGECGVKYGRVFRLPVVIINNRRVMFAPSVQHVVEVTSRPVFSWETIRSEWFGSSGHSALDESGEPVHVTLVLRDGRDAS